MAEKQRVQMVSRVVIATGDLFIKPEYPLELGGKGKGFRQISRIEKRIVVADDIETGFQHKIPLWLFGFLF